MIRETYSSRIKDTTVSLVNTRIESIRRKNILKTGFRVYKDGFIGVAGAIGSFSEEELFKEAEDALQKRIDYPPEPSTEQVMSLDMRKPVLNSQYLVKEVEEFLEELKERQPDFIFSNKISLSEVSVTLKNTQGLHLEYTDRALSFGLIFKEKSSTGVFDGSLGFLERKYDKKLILDEFDMILNAYRERVDLPKNGTYPVIFMPGEAPIDKLLTDLKADVFALGGSIFTGKLGQRIFNESFTFSQSIDPQRVYNTPFFDAEGIVNPGFEFNLIENGVLKAPYCDKKTAHKYGFKPSGSSVSSYDGVPQTALLGPAIAKTSADISQLLGGQPGILVLMAAGGDFTPGGDYATPVQLAMLFDGHGPVGRLPEFNMSSNVFEMFGKGYRGTAPNTIFPFSTGDFTVLEMNISSS